MEGCAADFYIGQSPVSGSRFQVSGPKGLVSGFKFQVSGSKNLVQGSKFKVQGYLNHGTGVSPMKLGTGVSPMKLETGVSPMKLGTGDSPMKLGTGDSPMKLETGVSPMKLEKPRQRLIRAFRLIILDESIDYDQLIIYPSFIHVSYVSRERNRRRLTKANGQGSFCALSRAQALELE